MRSNSSAEILSDSCISLCPFRLVVGSRRWRKDQRLNDIPAYCCQFQNSRKVSGNRPVLRQSFRCRTTLQRCFDVEFDLACFLLWKIRGQNDRAVARSKTGQSRPDRQHKYCASIPTGSGGRTWLPGSCPTTIYGVLSRVGPLDISRLAM